MDDHSLRRKLIKGSLAAPLVLTVGKAGASARTTFSACLSNNDIRPEPPLAVQQPDEAFRLQREVFEVVQRGGRDNARGRSAGEYVMGWDNRTMYRISHQQGTFQLDRMERTLAGGLDVELKPTGRNVQLLAYVDDSGTVVGLAPDTNGGEWTMKSCWASVVGMQRDNASQWKRLFG